MTVPWKSRNGPLVFLFHELNEVIMFCIISPLNCKSPHNILKFHTSHVIGHRLYQCLAFGNIFYTIQTNFKYFIFSISLIFLFCCGRLFICFASTSRAPFFALLPTETIFCFSNICPTESAKCRKLSLYKIVGNFQFFGSWIVVCKIAVPRNCNQYFQRENQSSPL